MKQPHLTVLAPLLLMLLVALPASAQELAVKRFEETNEITASQYPRKDFNGEACALIKVEVIDAITNAEGGVVGDIVDRGNEKWVYIIAHQRTFKIHFANHLSVQINTRDYNIDGLRGNVTYVLRLIEDYGGVEPPLSSPIALPNPVSLPSEMKLPTAADVATPHPSPEVITPRYVVELQASTVTSSNAVTPHNTAVVPSTTAVATPSTIATPPTEQSAAQVVASANGKKLTITVGGVVFNMIKLKGGKFIMGAKDGDIDERPLHEVKLSDYYIGETEVTQALWQKVMGSNPSNFKGETLPVEKVNWNDCQKFISKLNKLTGLTFRLPTEAEWEYAARSGNRRHGDRYSGSANVDDVAWYAANSYQTTHPVASKQANDLGIYDMSGNVWEWCADLYGSYSIKAQTDPTGAEYSASRVARGGSWVSGLNTCRVSYRSSYDPKESFFNLGLRLCLSNIAGK